VTAVAVNQTVAKSNATMASLKADGKVPKGVTKISPKVGKNGKTIVAVKKKDRKGPVIGIFK